MSVTAERLACEQVAREFGNPPDLTLMIDPNFFREVQDVALEVEAAHARMTGELESGAAAQRALAELGCGACQLAGCTVQEILAQKAQAGAESSRFLNKFNMLLTAPRWLTAARLSKSEINLAELKDPETLKKNVESGAVDIDQLMANTTNEISGIVTKKQLPELAIMPNIDSKAALEEQTVTTPAGKFTVIDASEAIGFNEAPMPAAEYAILTSKLLGRMSEIGSDGKPMVLSPDNISQKTVRQIPGGRMDEVRMTGKNRLYLLVTPTPGEATAARLIILGQHGGDAATQRKFFSQIS